MIGDEDWWVNHCVSVLERVKARNVFNDLKIDAILADTVVIELRKEITEIKEEMINLLKQI